MAVLGLCCGNAAADQTVYQVTAGGTTGIDLTALADTYYKDRLAGPDAKSVVCVTGTVTHAAASGAAFGLVGRGGRLNLWQTGLIDANRQLVHPLLLSGVDGQDASGNRMPAFDIWDGELTLGADWASQLQFASGSGASLQLAELTVTDTTGTPFTFNPANPITVSRLGTAGVVRLGQDGGRLTADFAKHFGCWSGDNLAKQHDNRYTTIQIGGASASGKAPGYAHVIYRTSGWVGCPLFGNNVTAAASLQQTEGRTNILTAAETCSQLNIPSCTRYGTESCLIRMLRTGGCTLYQPGWHGEFFQKSSDSSNQGRYIVESVNGGQIGCRISSGMIGTSSVVEFRSAGNVQLSFGDTSAAPSASGNYTPGRLYNPNGERVIWNQAGELILTSHPVIEGVNAFPYGSGHGGVKTTSTWMTINGTSQRFNSFYGGGTVCNIVNSDITFTVGEDGRDCTYDIVAAPATETVVGKYQGGTLTKQTNYGWTLEKVGAGTLTLAKAPPTALKVTAGAVVATAEMTLPPVDLAAGTTFTVRGAAVTSSGFTFADNQPLVLEVGGVLVLGADNADATFDLARLRGDATTAIRKVGTGTLTLTGSASNFSGAFDVQGGTLALDAGVTVDKALASVTVAAGATFSIPSGLSLRTFALTVRGTAGTENATYAATASEGVTALTGLAGAGRISVLPGTGIWTGAEDDDPTKAGNWKDFTLAPDLTSGAFSAVFAENDPAGTVNLATAIAFRGITLNDTITGFTFAKTAETGSLAVGVGGFSMAGNRTANAAARADVTAPLAATVPALWNWGTNTTFDLHAPLSGGGAIYKTGGGALYFHSTNSTHTGNIVVSNGNIHAYGNEPLGTGGTLILRAQDAKTDSSGHGVNLYLHNATISKNITRDGDYGYRRGIYCVGGTTNEIKGAVNDGTCPQLQVPANARLTLSGGYQCYYLNWGAAGTVVITNKPLVVTTKAEGTVQNLILCCTGNKMGSFSSTGSRPCGCNYGGFDLRVDNPLTFTASDREICFNGYIKLNGHDWTVPAIRSTLSTSFVTSESPATLTVEQVYPYEMQGLFTGAVNLLKRGACDLRLEAANTSTGTVCVTEGTLSFTNSASWKAAPSVSVTGTGRLEAWNTEVFGGRERKAPYVELTLADDGVYAFPEGVTGTQRVGFLWLDGAVRPARTGVYGALDNTSVPAAFRTKHITGAGTLHVLGNGQGLVVIIR